MTLKVKMLTLGEDESIWLSSLGRRYPNRLLQFYRLASQTALPCRGPEEDWLHPVCHPASTLSPHSTPSPLTRPRPPQPANQSACYFRCTASGRPWLGTTRPAQSNGTLLTDGNGWFVNRTFLRQNFEKNTQNGTLMRRSQCATQ